MASSLGTTPIYHGGYVLAPTNSSPILRKRTYHTKKIKHSLFGGLYKGISLRAKREVPVYVCKAQTVGSSEFQEKVLNSDIPVLVDFVADWCGPCKLISPFIDWASEEYKGKLNVYKIDHDANPEVVEKYKVYGLPTLILFKNGKEVSGSRREGAITKEKLKVYLDQLLGNAATL